MAINFPFPAQAELTAIALAYRNEAYIADAVFPRVQVPSRTFKWQEFTRDDLFTLPELQVGRKGVPSEVEFTGIEQSAYVNDFGLDDVIPQEDIESAPDGYSPEGRAVEGIAELLALGREKRLADALFDADTYPVGNKETLSGTSQFNDFANSDPYTIMMTAMDGMLMRPNTIVMGREVWSKLRVHPKITAALAPSAVGNTPDTDARGMPATAQAVADLFEVDNIYVGESWLNTAAPGQTASLSRVWGKSVAMMHQNPAASIRGNAITFGFTAEFGTRVAGRMDEPKIGLRGGQRVRVGESVKELIVAPDVGYLISAAVA